LLLGLYRVSWPEPAMGFNVPHLPYGWAPASRSSLDAGFENIREFLASSEPQGQGQLPTRSGAQGVATRQRHSSTTDLNDRLPSRVFCFILSARLSCSVVLSTPFLLFRFSLSFFLSSFFYAVAVGCCYSPPASASASAQLPFGAAALPRRFALAVLRTWQGSHGRLPQIYLRPTPNLEDQVPVHVHVPQ
jgi:hypothetical protein